MDNTVSGVDDLNRQQNDVYVAMTVTHNAKTQNYFYTFSGKTGDVNLLSKLQIQNGTAVVGFSVSWVKPASATAIGSEAVVIGEIPEVTTSPSVEPSAEETAAPQTSAVLAE